MTSAPRALASPSSREGFPRSSRNLPPAPLGARQIEVTFEIDVNGIVSVSAQDQATGQSQNVVINSSGGLSQSEATPLAAETRAREDKARKDPESALRQPEHEARARRPS